MMEYDYSVPGFIAMCIVMVIVAVGSVGLRFWSRYVVLGGAYGLDDWFALASLPPILLVLACGFAATSHQLGVHMKDLDPPTEANTLLLIYYIASASFCLAIGLPKLSMLAFYARLFGLWQRKTTLWKVSFASTAFVTFAWIVGETLIIIFGCTPIHKYWNPMIPGRCIPEAVPLFEGPIVSLVNDLMILLLPLPEIFKLQKMRMREKIWVSVAMTVGYSVALLCVGRVVFIAKSLDQIQHDFSYAVLPIAYWLVAEPSSLLLAVSFFPIAQLTKRAWHFGIRSLFDNRDRNRLEILRQRWSNEDLPHGRGKGLWVSDSRLLCMSPWGTTTANIASGGGTGVGQVNALDSMLPNDPRRVERIKVDTEVRVDYEYTKGQRGTQITVEEASASSSTEIPLQRCSRTRSMGDMIDEDSDGRDKESLV